jgi:hypothetical protein
VDLDPQSIISRITSRRKSRDPQAHRFIPEPDRAVRDADDLIVRCIVRQGGDGVLESTDSLTQHARRRALANVLRGPPRLVHGNDQQ